MVTRPVNRLITSRTARVRITAMDGDRVGWMESRWMEFLFSNFEVHIKLPSLLPHLCSYLVEYALGDFVADIYEVDHHVYVRIVVKINESDN